MSAPWSQQWFDDCKALHNKILTGTYRHWCPRSFDLPIDETDHAFSLCDCFKCRGCGTLMEPRAYPCGRSPMEMHDDIFECPKKRWWNFWRHPDLDKRNRQWKV